MTLHLVLRFAPTLKPETRTRLAKTMCLCEPRPLFGASSGENDNAAATGLPTAAASTSAYIRTRAQSFAGRRWGRRRISRCGLGGCGRCLGFGSQRGRDFGGRSGGSHFIVHERNLVKQATQRAYNAS